jgi:membrane-associated phospholipid phosphatase
MSINVKQVLFRLSFTALIPLVSFIHYSLNTYRDGVRVLKTALDDSIPLVSFFAIPYLFWFAYIFLALLFFAINDGRYYFKLLFSIVTGMLTSFVFFIFFPTTVPRPEIISDDFMSSLVKIIYSFDNPYNVFPSIHVVNAVLVSAFLLSYSIQFLWNTNKYYANMLIIYSIVNGIMISLSTVFIKQHYIPDVVAGTVIALFYYMIFNHGYQWNIKTTRRIPSKDYPPAL